MDYSIGLSESEASEYRLKYGKNEIAKKQPVNVLAVLMSQVKSPLIYVLFVAAIVNIFLGKLVDSGVIILMVALNTALGFIQEYKAERSLDSLARLLVPKAKVRRDKEWKVIEAAMIVPGDVVRLEVGQFVPADGVLTRADNMFVNEAILTGESMPVEKKQFDFPEGFSIYHFQLKETDESMKCFMGTTVERGLGEMLVVNTGGATRLGQIAKDLTRSTVGKTPLMQKLERLSRLLAILVIMIIPIILFVGWVRGLNLNDIFLLGLALAVAAIPEGLAVGLTVILTVGMQKILKRKALVRKLSAAETLGNIDVICLDKTGTLTEGKMKAVGAEGEKTKVMLGAVLCNDERDPLEVAMMAWAIEQDPKLKEQRQIWERTATIPFDYRYKYIVTRHRKKSGDEVEYISGAPEVVLSLCNNPEGWKERMGEFGARGYRMVGFGYKTLVNQSPISRDEVGDYEWLGVVLFEDPVREGVAASLARILAANVKVKVVTGDYKETAWAVLAAAGLVSGPLKPDEVISGEELAVATPERIEKTILFSRVNPEQKLTIVKALQQRKHVVAMTGDGVNDAPALKQADIGVVVGNASDVARETADLVLLDNNFETILAAIEEGRVMMDNLRKVVLYLLADSFAAVVMVAVSLILNWPLPLLATQILWINMVSDGFSYVALAVEPETPGILKRRPLRREEPIINLKMLILILLISVISGMSALGVFGVYVFDFKVGLDLARTVTLVTLGMVTLAYVFSIRTLFDPIHLKNLFINKYLILGVIIGLVMLVLVVYIPELNYVFGTKPLKLIDWLPALVVALLMLVLVERIKVVKLFKDGID